VPQVIVDEEGLPRARREGDLSFVDAGSLADVSRNHAAEGPRQPCEMARIKHLDAARLDRDVVESGPDLEHGSRSTPQKLPPS